MNLSQEHIPEQPEVQHQPENTSSLSWADLLKAKAAAAAIGVQLGADSLPDGPQRRSLLALCRELRGAVGVAIVASTARRPFRFGARRGADHNLNAVDLAGITRGHQ